MQLNLIDLSRRLYCKLNALHLKWALRSIERRMAKLDIAWLHLSDLSCALACDNPSAPLRRVGSKVAAMRCAIRVEFRQLAAQRQQIRSELSALGVAS